MRKRLCLLVACAAVCSFASAQAVTSRPAKWAAPVQVEGVPNLHKVSAALYRSAQPTAAGMRELKKMGVRTVINLRSFHSDKDEIGDAGLPCERIFMKAWHPELEEAQRFLRIVTDPRRQPVLVHCQHGADRTGTMCAIYRIAVEGWPKEEAVREMRDGGFGFHEVWQNLPGWIDGLNVNDLRRPENLALKKPYVLAPAPNYSYCTDAGDASQLTDGVYSQGHFWTQKTTVGWNNASPVFCTIDLGRVQPICGVSWSCAAGVAGVAWPECLYVLASDDKKAWTFLGDLCVLGTESRVPPEKGYAQFRYASDKMKGRGRYVCVVAASQPFCFADEIEVWRGPDAWLEGDPPGQKAADPKAFYLQARIRSGVAGRLRADLASILSQADGVSGPDAVAKIRARAEALKEQIPAFAESLPADQKTVLPYGVLHESILALHAPVLRAAGVEKPLVWQGGRWSPLALTERPPAGAAAEKVALDLMRGEVRGEAFNITNPDEAPLDVSLTVKGMPRALNLELREVLFTDTPSRTPVAAALTRLEPGANGALSLRVPGGCTRQVWLSCRRPGGEARTYEGAIGIAADGGRLSRDLPLSVKLRDLDFPKRPALHVGGWDYVQGRADYYKAPGNLEANLALMRDLYVDSPWATPAVFPKGAKFDGDGKLVNEDALDYSEWDSWVARWAGARNYCVFFSVGESFSGEKMGTPRFGAMVGGWLGAWVRHLKKQGLSAGQLVVLLVDEPHGPKQDAVIVAWASAIKAASLGVTLFEDPTYADPSKGDPAMYAAADVLCPNTPMMLAQGEPFRAFYRSQQSAGKTLWLYSCSGPAKLLDPVAYHRAQPWLAFQMGAEGSFYWAFGCGGGIGDSWHAYAQAHAEYSPYFVSPDGVTEGKHSEAVREGAQDYEYLRMLRDALSKARASGGGAGWQGRAASLLTDGVAEAVRSVAASNQLWHVEKDRSAMDAVRVRALDLLESAPAK